MFSFFFRDRLLQLTELKNDELISAEEFHEKREIILSRLTN